MKTRKLYKYKWKDGSYFHTYNLNFKDEYFEAVWNGQFLDKEYKEYTLLRLGLKKINNYKNNRLHGLSIKIH